MFNLLWTHVLCSPDSPSRISFSLSGFDDFYPDSHRDKASNQNTQ